MLMCNLMAEWLIRPIFALKCMLQLEQVNSENDDSDDDPLTLAWLPFCSFCCNVTLLDPAQSFLLFCRICLHIFWHVGIQSRSHMHIRGLAVPQFLDFNLCVKPESISIPDIST